MAKVINTTGPVGGVRRPLEVATDSTEKFNYRVAAINSIGLSSAPKALAMLAIISNGLPQGDNLKDWSEYWLKDLSNNYGLSGSDIEQVRELVQNNPDPNSAEIVRLVNLFASGKGIEQEYDPDSLKIRSSLPWTQTTQYEPDELPPEIKKKYDEYLANLKNPLF